MPRDPVVSENALLNYLACVARAERVEEGRVTKLRGGAVMQHYRLDLALRGGPFAGKQRWVLRRDGATKLGLGLPRAHEFALQRALFEAGMKVAEPLFMCCDSDLLGAPFFVMRFLPGEADGAAVVAKGTNEALAEQLGRELARLHALRLGNRLHFLHPPPADPAQARIEECARLLADDEDPHPVAEWGLRWLREHAPTPAPAVLCHGDFRTGNYLADDNGLAGVLDWDFAGWGDGHEDIAWFCSLCWRFGAGGREAGGIASRAALYRGYEARSASPIDPVRVHYWEVMAALRWLVLALKQRDRYLKQGEQSLDLALTGRRPAECELAILQLTAGSRVAFYGGFSTGALGEMRDRPSGDELARLVRELGGEPALVARCLAIAEREQRLGATAFADCRAALSGRYGEAGDRELLTRLAAEVRDGSDDRGLRAMLWAITVQKLQESNPEFLSANGFVEDPVLPEGRSPATSLGDGREGLAACLDVARQPASDEAL